MRSVWTLMLLLAACAPGAKPFGEPAAEGTACSRAVGEEQCVDAVLATRDGDRFTVEATLAFPGYTLGFDSARLHIEGTIHGSEVDVEALIVPVGVQCTSDVVHGDHCHWRVTEDRACAVEASPTSVTVDALTDAGISLRFEAEAPVEVPGCCSNSCSDSPMEPEAEPAGPYRVTGAVNVRWD